ncbi:MAG: 50S ribosomal protein L29 [Microgenomates group bacterium]
MKKIIKDLKSKTIEQLNKEVDLVKKEIVKIKLSWKINPPKDTNLLKKKRKYLAQLLTVISQKKFES